ncbi:MAG: hypothetical protein M3245_03805 [Actinomycetota bacterium]|nr:hypothetical protein [Actinomycetota bacterium]
MAERRTTGAHRAPGRPRPAAAIGALVLVAAVAGVAMGPPSIRSPEVGRIQALRALSGLEPLIHRRHAVVRAELLPALDRASRTAADDHLIQRRGPRWLDALAAIRARWRAIAVPEELGETKELFLLALDGSLAAARSLVVATESTRTRRAQLIRTAADESQAAERLWDQAVQRARSDLGRLGVSAPGWLR